MKMNRFLQVVGMVAVCGCVAQRSNPPVSPAEGAGVCQRIQPAQAIPKRQFTERQIDMLRTFALSESPQLWKTAQALKAEGVARKAALVKLCKEMESFGRDPKTDPDVAALRSTQIELEGALTTIYTKIEDAYIAYKKMQATPGRKEYADMMRSALEDGIHEADRMSARFKEMSRNK